MISAVTKPSAIPATRTGLVSPQTRFGAGSGKAAVERTADIAYLSTAKEIQKAFKWAKSDIRVGGLSLEDVASRLLTLFGIYLPQGYFAIKQDTHPWETNGRNAVVWLMTLALTSMTKSENYGVNTVLLNPIMQQKGAAVRPAFMKPVLDRLRMDVDYLTILENAGISISDAEKEGALKGKKALWASSWLDVNKLEKIQNRYRELLEQSKRKAELSPDDQRMLKAIPSFFKRINSFNLVSIGIITAATVYFIGGVAMHIVNRVFSPLDKDYEGPNAKPKQAHPTPAPTPPRFYPSQPPPQRTPPGFGYGYPRQFTAPLNAYTAGGHRSW